MSSNIKEDARRDEYDVGEWEEEHERQSKKQEIKAEQDNASSKFRTEEAAWEWMKAQEHKPTDKDSKSLTDSKHSLGLLLFGLPLKVLHALIPSPT